MQTVQASTKEHLLGREVPKNNVQIGVRTMFVPQHQCHLWANHAGIPGLTDATLDLMSTNRWELWGHCMNVPMLTVCNKGDLTLGYARFWRDPPTHSVIINQRWPSELSVAPRPSTAHLSAALHSLRGAAAATRPSLSFLCSGLITTRGLSAPHSRALKPAPIFIARSPTELTNTDG